jgi:hypothetical protein
MRGAAISAKAAKRVRRRVQRLGAQLRRDEGNSQGEIPVGEELDHPTNQGGSATYGRRVSRGGSVYGGERRESGNINAGRNARKWAPGSRISASNRGHPTANKGPIPRRGGQYGGGGRDTQ